MVGGGEGPQALDARVVATPGDDAFLWVVWRVWRAVKTAGTYKMRRGNAFEMTRADRGLTRTTV